MSIENILQVCRTINHPRNMESVLTHFKGEVNELKQEVLLSMNGMPNGVDGILGEAVDNIIMVIDLAYQQNPQLTAKEVDDVICRKLNKWIRVYSDNPPLVKTQVQILDERLKSMKATNFNVFPGSKGTATQEEVAKEINRVFDAIEAGLIKTQVEKDCESINQGNKFYSQDNF